MSEYPQPQRKGWHPAAVVAAGCGFILFGIIGFIAFVLTVTFGSLRASEPYRHAVARAKSDPRVIVLLGSPVETSLFFSGSVNTNNDSGSADFTIPLRGPKGKAKLHLEATRANRVWSYTEMTVTPEKGEPVSLLPSTPGSTSTAPPGD